MCKAIAALGLVVFTAGLASAQATDKEQKRIANAVQVLQELRATPDKDIPLDLWNRAACVAVIPGLKKAAFIIGGEYGRGIMSCRIGNGWSAPVFLTLEKGSWGAQIGGESVDLVLLAMNHNGMQKLLQDKVSLGGEASIAGGPVGRDARASTDVKLKAEILSYSRSQGLFAGIDLSGGVIKADHEADTDLYGRKVVPMEVVTQRTPVPPAAKPFIATLMQMSSTSNTHR